MLTATTLTVQCLVPLSVLRRFEVDLSGVPINEPQLYTRPLNHGRGRVVFQVRLYVCNGVFVSDLDAAPLEDPRERDNMRDRYVSGLPHAIWSTGTLCAPVFTVILMLKS